MTTDIHIQTTGPADFRIGTDKWTDAKAIDIKREGDTIEVRMVLADGQRIPLAEHALKDGAAIRIPFEAGVVRVKG